MTSACMIALTLCADSIIGGSAAVSSLTQDSLGVEVSVQVCLSSSASVEQQ